MAGNNHDLTFTIMPFLDRHMVLPVLESLQDKKLFKERDLLEAKLKLVSKTSMVDFGIEQYKTLYKKDTVPEEMSAHRSLVYKALQETTKACGGLLDLLNCDDEHTESKAEKLRMDGNFNPAYLKEQYNITNENLEALYPYAKRTFDCGRYQNAADTLFYYRLLTQDEDSSFQALWGKLAAEILMVNIDSAVEDLKELKEAVDQRLFVDQLEQMQQRTWLVHWGLFIFFSAGEEDLDSAVEFYLQDRIWNTIQTNCPHILRYVAVAIIISGKGKKGVIKELVKVLSQEEHNYSDPITKFLTSLYVDFDFDAAQQYLAESQPILANDFFLQHLEEGVFVTCGRQLLFETCCSIHKCLDISSLCERLQITEDMENTIVQMIRASGIDAKIDTQKNRINMMTKFPSVYSKVLQLERSKALANRSAQLAAQVEKKYAMMDNRSDF